MKSVQRGAVIVGLYGKNVTALLLSVSDGWLVVLVHYRVNFAKLKMQKINFLEKLLTKKDLVEIKHNIFQWQAPQSVEEK